MKIYFALYFMLLSSSVMPSPDYVTYIRGDMPLILSIPHGGALLPDSIPNRAPGCYIDGQCVYGRSCVSPSPTHCPVQLLKDSYTKDIGLGIAQRIYDVTGKHPHVVVNELHRRKMDANRELHLATCDVAETVEAFGNYTLYIREAMTRIGLVGDGRGLFVDVHGQTHAEAWIELGYTLSKTDLNSGRYDLEESSIRALAGRACAERDRTCWDDLISGDLSLGRFLADKGLTVVPGPDHSSPGRSGNYFSGGHNTKTYGSRSCGNIDAIQMELPREIRFADDRSWYVDRIADAVLLYMETQQYL